MDVIKRPRGRPKHIEDSDILDAVLGVFWKKGYAGATLSDLAEAAGVSRPRLYDAFPDKTAMYLAVVDRVIEETKAALDAALAAKRPLADELLAFFRMSIDHYLSEGKYRGCLVTTTAPAEAIETPAVRLALKRLIDLLDQSFMERIKIAQERGEIGVTLPAGMLARQVTAMVQSLALRARSGADVHEMQQTASILVQLIMTAAANDVLAESRRREPEQDSLSSAS